MDEYAYRQQIILKVGVAMKEIGAQIFEYSERLEAGPEYSLKQDGHCDNTSKVVNTSLRPCILVLDSLAIPRSNAMGKIKRYLTEEWKCKHANEEEKDFSTFTVLSHSKLQVPLQENSSDCGLFVLQYVQTLLQKVIVKNQPVPRSTKDWFPLSVITDKRKSLRDLLITLSDIKLSDIPSS